jgi:redox-sensitive bicupin YhaK (pirin superfamily)
MPAVTVQNPLVLPRVARPDPASDRPRPVAQVQVAQSLLEGAGFPVRRPFPAPGLSLRYTDPFLLLDHMGAVEYGPGEAKGAPWHPHRGFETVTYMMDGVMRHHDSNGGGGLISDGATQWMTAGSGILHDEMPTEELVMKGGVFHGVQLWVNLPKDKKWTPPRYQDIGAEHLVLLASDDGASLIRLIAGDLGGHHGAGITWTPITYAHATISAGARLHIPWPSSFNAMVYVLVGSGTVGREERPIQEGELALFGNGDSIMVTAVDRQSSRSPTLEVLLLGGQPIREPIFHWGPFVMNSHEEILQAFEDYRSGRMGIIPATTVDLQEAARHDGDG